MLFILKFEETVQKAASAFSPAVGQLCFELARTFNQFYHDNPIIDETNPATSLFRLKLSQHCADTIRKSLYLLGIDAPERM